MYTLFCKLYITNLDCCVVRCSNNVKIICKQNLLVLSVKALNRGKYKRGYDDNDDFFSQKDHSNKLVFAVSWQFLPQLKIIIRFSPGPGIFLRRFSCEHKHNRHHDDHDDDQIKNWQWSCCGVDDYLTTVYWILNRKSDCWLSHSYLATLTTVSLPILQQFTCSAYLYIKEYYC